MNWSTQKFGQPDLDLRAEKAPFEEALRKNVLFSRLQDLVGWGRKNSMWPFNFGQ